MRPNHLFRCDDGALYDTRDPDWSRKPPLRPVFYGSKRTIETTHDLKAALRAGRYTDLGGYPLYFVASDGAALSFESVRSELWQVLDSIRNGHNDGWRVVGVEINYEDSELYCDHSGERIESAYAEPDGDAA